MKWGTGKICTFQMVKARYHLWNPSHPVNSFLLPKLYYYTHDHGSAHESVRSGKPQLEFIPPQKTNSQDFKRAFFSSFFSNYLIRLWKAGFSRRPAIRTWRTSQRQEEMSPQWGENKLARLRSNWLRSDPFLWFRQADFRKRACYFRKSPSRGKVGRGVRLYVSVLY